MGQVQNYIESLNRLTEAFSDFYAEPGNPSDIDGLYYVARSYAKTYASLLEWGIEVKSTVVPEEYERLLSVFAKIPTEAIEQIEEFPIKSIKTIERIERKTKEEVDKDIVVNLNLTVSISDDIMQLYYKELDMLKKKELQNLKR